MHIDDVPSAGPALFALFEEKKWIELNPLSELLVDPDARALLQPPLSLTEQQLKYRFVRWRRNGGPLSAAACALINAQIVATVDTRVGSVPLLLRRIFAAVAQGPLSGRLPLFMPDVLKALENNPDCNAFLEARVQEHKDLVVDYFGRRASSARSNSLAYVMAIIKSCSRRQEVWVGQARPAYVTSAFSPASTLAADALRAENVDHLIALTHDSIDSELSEQFRKSFEPIGMAEALTIPPFLGNGSSGELNHQMLAYIAGGALTAMREAAYEDLDPSHSSLLLSFVDVHSVRKDIAEASGVPINLIAARNNDSLIFPSREMYSLVVLIEHAFSSLLSMENVLAGGTLLSEVYHFTRESNAMPEAFDACMEPVRRAARAGEYADVDSGTLLEKVLKLYMRIRG